jgi:hypothetical protein
MTSPIFCKWPSDLADAVAKTQYKEQVLDYAVTIGRALGPYGLAHRIISNAEHLARYGVARAPIIDPGPYLAGDAAVVANHKRALEYFDLQQKLDPILELAVEAGWPDRIRNMMLVNHSLRHLTLENQFAYVDENLALTQGDLKDMLTKVSSPYIPGSKIESHVAAQRQALAHLAAAFQPVANIEATALMMRAFTSTPRAAQEYAPCMAEFYKDYGALGDQTPANFSSHVIKYVNERLVHHQSVINISDAARATRLAQAATAIIPPTHPSPAELADYHAYLAYKALPKTKTGAAAKPPPAVTTAPRAPRTLAPGAPAFYCWSHGTDFTGTYPHYSHENCKAKRPGHQRAASLANQMGGKPA